MKIPGVSSVSRYFGRNLTAAKTATIDNAIKDFKVEKDMDGTCRYLWRYAASGVQCWAIATTALATFGIGHAAASVQIAAGALGKTGTLTSGALGTAFLGWIGHLARGKYTSHMADFAKKLEKLGLSQDEKIAAMRRYVGQNGYPIFSNLMTRGKKLQRILGIAEAA